MSDKSKKANLFPINTTPVDSVPVEAYDEFKQMVLQGGLKPSEAIRTIIKKYDCSDMHDTTVIHFLRRTYPDVDLGRRGFRFKIIDSAYPQNPGQFSDDDFDKGIEELLSLPPVEY